MELIQIGNFSISQHVSRAIKLHILCPTNIGRKIFLIKVLRLEERVFLVKRVKRLRVLSLYLLTDITTPASSIMEISKIFHSFSGKDLKNSDQINLLLKRKFLRKLHRLWLSYLNSPNGGGGGGGYSLKSNFNIVPS